MKFSELKKEIESDSRSVSNHKEYYNTYFKEDMRSRMDDLEGKFLYHLYNDLTLIEVKKDLENYLGGRDYGFSENFARDCVQTSFLSKNIYGLRIRGWTTSALSCFDNFLLTYIKDDLKEKVKRYSSVKEERWKYRHLMDRDGEDKEIGTCFDTIYQQRNALLHIEVVDDNGDRRQKPPTSRDLKVKKAIVLERFKIALTLMEKKIH